MEYKNRYSLQEIIRKIKVYNGITRKNKINMITKIIGDPKIKNGKYITTFTDDAATIDIETGTDELLLFATDGIWDQLIDKSPWWAGYAAVLSNVNDIYAMGGIPLAMVDVLSSNDDTIIKEVCNGMKECLNKFDVPIVGGHTHPDSSRSSVSISIVGKVHREALIRSDTAKNQQIILEALDLRGKNGLNSRYSWESTLEKNNFEIKKLYGSIVTASQNKLISSGKDISNPGIIGTIGMLCEASHVGAVVDITKILTPNSINIQTISNKNNSFDFIDWLLTHPSSGFIFTVSESNVESCIKILEFGGFSTSKIGFIDNTNKLKLKDAIETKELFDFNEVTLF